MSNNEEKNSEQVESISPEDLAMSQKIEEKIEGSDKNSATASAAKAPKKSNETLTLMKEKLHTFIALAWVKLNDLLDLKGLEDKIPYSIKNRLPENVRLVTVPIFFLVVGFFLIFVLAIFAPEANKRSRLSDIPVVRVVEAKKESLQIPVFSQGLVLPENEIKLISLVNGEITYISPNFVEGGYVKEGELMLQVSDRSYQQDKARADANLARAKAAQVAKQNELRIQGTLRSITGQAQLIEVNAAVDAAQADVQRVEDLIESTKFVAPFSGLLRGVSVQAGQSVRAGVPVGSVFSIQKAIVNVPLSDRQLSLLDLSNLNQHIDTTKSVKNESTETEITAENQQESEQLLEKDKMKNISLPDVKVMGEFGDRVFYWKGKVIRSAGARNEVNRMYYVTVEIDKPFEEDPEQPGRPPLMPGFYVQLEIEGQKIDGLVKLPRSAFKTNQKVWTVNEEQKLQSQDVELFYRGKDVIYVSKGIEHGAQVVFSNLEVMADGMEVSVASTMQMEDASVTESSEGAVELELNTSVQEEGSNE